MRSVLTAAIAQRPLAPLIEVPLTQQEGARASVTAVVRSPSRFTPAAVAAMGRSLPLAPDGSAPHLSVRHVQLAGKVGPVVRYLKSALAADADAVTDALIAICTDPQAAQARRCEIRAALKRNWQKKGFRALTRNFALTLHCEGPDGWLQRASTFCHLMLNTRPLGLVLRNECLHLSRLLAAMLVTLRGLYVRVPRCRVIADGVWAVNTFPARMLRGAVRGKRSEASAAGRAARSARSRGAPYSLCPRPSSRCGPERRRALADPSKRPGAGTHCRRRKLAGVSPVQRSKARLKLRPSE